MGTFAWVRLRIWTSSKWWSLHCFLWSSCLASKPRNLSGWQNPVTLWLGPIYLVRSTGRSCRLEAACNHSKSLSHEQEQNRTTNQAWKSNTGFLLTWPQCPPFKPSSRAPWLAPDNMAPLCSSHFSHWRIFLPILYTYPTELFRILPCNWSSVPPLSNFHCALWSFLADTTLCQETCLSLSNCRGGARDWRNDASIPHSEVTGPLAGVLFKSYRYPRSFQGHPVTLALVRTLVQLKKEYS